MAESVLGELSAHVDLRKGLVVVTRLEDASDGEAPPRNLTGHRCTRAEIDELGRLFGDYLRSRREMGEPVGWACTADRCELRGMMEFDPTRVVRFERDAGGALVVSGVEMFEDAGSGPEFVAELRTAVAQEFESLRRDCP